MKTLYFDCGMGAAGDMLMASLYEICPDKEKFLKSMNEMGLPGLSIEAEPSVKCGITGTHMKVTIHGEEEESVDVDLQGHEKPRSMSTSIIRSITMKIVSIAMLTITTMIMKIPTMTIVTNPIIMPTKWQSQQQNRQFTNVYMINRLIKTTRIKTISITPTPMTTIIIADMIIPTIMVTPTTITPAWQVFPISSST